MAVPQATAVQIRMYNVGFGDCFLLTFVTEDRPYTMLIDCGRLSGSSGVGPEFWTVVQQLIGDLPRVEGKAHIDVVVMTHRHRDHVHGFSKADIWQDVTAGEVWMPWTENPKDPVALGLSSRQDTAARTALQALRALGVVSGGAFEVALNSITNAAAMGTLEKLSARPIRYLPDVNTAQSTTLDSSSTGGVLPGGVNIRVLGPSHDPKIIAKLDPPRGQAYLRLGAAAGADNDAPAAGPRPELPTPCGGRWEHPRQSLAPIVAQRLGLDDKQLDRLLRSVRESARNDAENLAFDVDNALNGTSLVLLIEVGQQTLLFPGDAQWGTWNVILNTPEWQDRLKQTTFLKVGHHGSHNATPVGFVEGGYLHHSTAMVSVAPTTNTAEGWKAIPKRELLNKLLENERVTTLLRSDEGLPAGILDVARPLDDVFTEITLDAAPST